MSEENKLILKKRAKSLGWRIGAMVLAVLVSFTLDNLNLLSLPPIVVTLLGLVLAEISKLLNNQKLGKS